MSSELVNIRCLKMACSRLGISCEELDKNGNLVKVNFGGGLFFANYAIPFNSGSVEQICKDKEFTFFILKDALAMPETFGFFDPDYRRDGYEKYKTFKDIGEVVSEVCEKFTMPVIVKKNSGMRGENVFLCLNTESVETALLAIFSKHSTDYDYLALAQKYIKPKREFRLVVFKEKAVLVYEKKNDKARFVGNLSPLHWEGSKAEIISDDGLVLKLEDFIKPVFRILPVVFGGFDIIEDEAGKLWLLEINSRPGFSYLVRDNGEDPLVAMYERILECG